MNKKMIYCLLFTGCFFLGSQQAVANEIDSSQAFSTTSRQYFKDGDFWYDINGNKIDDPSSIESSPDSSEIQISNSSTNSTESTTEMVRNSVDSQEQTHLTNTSDSGNRSTEMIPKQEIKQSDDTPSLKEKETVFPARKETADLSQSTKNTNSSLESTTSYSLSPENHSSTEPSGSIVYSQESSQLLQSSSDRSAALKQAGDQKRFPETGSENNYFLVFMGLSIIGLSTVLLQKSKKKRFLK